MQARQPQSQPSPDARITLRLPGDVMDDIRELAKANDRSLNSEIIHGLRTYIRVGRWRQEQP